MRKRKKTKKISVLIIILVLILCAALFLSRSNFSADEKSNVVPISSTENKDAPQDSNIETPKINPDKDEHPAGADKTQSLSIPVLMYHYVRDLNDPSDQIGTNLSVSPQTFASQLDYIKQQGFTTITFNDLLSGNIPKKPVVLTFDDGYQDFFTAAYPELKKRNMTAVSFIIVNSIGKGNYMTNDEIVQIEKGGIEIGSHTLSHPDLSTLKTAQAIKEITESKAFLEKITGNKIISFCYPSGKFNAETETLVKNAGYNYAVTTKGGVTTFQNAYELNRYRMNHDTSIKSVVSSK